MQRKSGNKDRVEEGLDRTGLMEISREICFVGMRFEGMRDDGVRGGNKDGKKGNKKGIMMFEDITASNTHKWEMDIL